MGDSQNDTVRVDFDRNIKLAFHGSTVTSDAGLLAYRELDDALGLTSTAASGLHDTRTGQNTQHSLLALIRQSIYSRLAGYEDVNDAERLCLDPALRAVVGGRAKDNQAASTSEMARFETETLSTKENLKHLMNLSGQWIDQAHRHRKLTKLILDMDSSVSETYGHQEGSAYNGHFACTCYHPLFLFNQFGDLERVLLRRGNRGSAKYWRRVLLPVIDLYRGLDIPKFFRGDAAFAGPKLLRLLEQEAFRYAIRIKANAVLERKIAPLAQAARGPAVAQAEGLLPQLPLPSRVVGICPPGGGQGGVACGRVVPARRLHRHQPEVALEEGRPLLQPARYGGAVDKRGQECGEVDEAVVPAFQGQRGAVAAVRPGLQPGQLPAATGAAAADPGLDADDLREKLVKIGAKVVTHAKYVIFQLAEVAVPRQLFAAILERIGRLRLACASG